MRKDGGRKELEIPVNDIRGVHHNRDQEFSKDCRGSVNGNGEGGGYVWCCLECAVCSWLLLYAKRSLRRLFQPWYKGGESSVRKITSAAAWGRIK